MNEIPSVNDNSFQNDVLDSDVPVVVDFWAEWCGPCKMIAPILQQVAQEYNGKVKFYKMNVDENEKTPPKYGIRGIPTLLIFKEGDAANRVVGAVSKKELTEFIDNSL